MSEIFEISIYRTKDDNEPYAEWERTLDKTVQARIDARFTRIRELGNLGVHEAVGEGVFELKFDFGPGYRIYFGFRKTSNLLLLLGGSKRGQQRDIEKAKKYWRDSLSQQKAKK